MAERTCMGRRVVHHSPDQHPAQKDPFARQPNIDWAEGGPVATGGSESYNAQNKRQSRVGGFGKRSWKS